MTLNDIKTLISGRVEVCTDATKYGVTETITLLEGTTPSVFNNASATMLEANVVGISSQGLAVRITIE